jgi:hypothetical protein
MVVELAPSASSDGCPAVRVIPTTEPVAIGVAGGVVLGGVVLGGVVLGGVVLGGVVLGGVVLGGVVLGGVVLGGVEVGGGCSPCPPPPAFWQPAKMPSDTRLTDTSSQPYACHPRLGRTYRYLLL